MTIVGELIAGATGDEPVSRLLRKVRVVAARASIVDLDSWVGWELEGYPVDAPLPDYRGPFSSDALGDFSGPFQSGLTNAPIPPSAFDRHRAFDPFFVIEIRQPVAELEELAANPQGGRVEWPADLVGHANALIDADRLQIYPMMYLQRAWLPFGSHQFASVLDAVRNRVLTLALALEQKFPDAGSESGAPVPPAAGRNLVMTVYGTANVAVDSNRFSQTIAPTVPIGDWDALSEALRSAGLPEEFVGELGEAIAEDGDAPGPKVAGWLSRVLVASKEVGVSVAGEVIGAAINSYFGL